MDPNTIVLLMFIMFMILLFIQVPIALCLAFASIFYITQSNGLSMIQMATSMFSAVDSFPLMAVPLFILCGAVIEGGGLGRRLVDFCASFIGQVTGGYAMVTVITCAFFGAISGSALATVAAIGGIMLPVMADAGYDKKFSIGLTCCAGCLGIIIPPSIPMIMYASSTNASIGTLFIGGFGPGIFLAAVLCVVSYFICKKRGYHGNGVKFRWKNVAVATKDAIWALLIPVIILGGIYGGIFTPTEAAAVAVAYSIIAGALIYKELTLEKLLDVISNSAVTNGTILLVWRYCNRIRKSAHHGPDTRHAGRAVQFPDQQHDYDPDYHEHPAPRCRLFYGYGCSHHDPFADAGPHCGCLWHRCDPLRSDYGPESGHRLVHAACRFQLVCGKRPYEGKIFNRGFGRHSVFASDVVCLTRYYLCPRINSLPAQIVWLRRIAPNFCRE
jgi:hypothetical protein